MNVRTTVTLDENLLKLLKHKAVETKESVSSLLNEIVRDSFREDQEDLKAFKECEDEETIPFETLLSKLASDGKL